MSTEKKIADSLKALQKDRTLLVDRIELLIKTFVSLNDKLKESSLFFLPRLKSCFEELEELDKELLLLYKMELVLSDDD